MSLWWVKKAQLDKDQLKLIEKLNFVDNHLVLGPPGCGKTNVLLRRAQFARVQGYPNALLLTFTRALTEFIKTGCYSNGKEVFPVNCVTTIESWIRELYEQHEIEVPDCKGSFIDRKRLIAEGAIELAKSGFIPKYEVLYVDEAQDLLPEEVSLVLAWAERVFMVGDDRQKIYDHADGFASIQSKAQNLQIHKLLFHYRMAKEICTIADRILIPETGNSLASTCHYE